MHPMRVVGVRVELPQNQPIVLLRERDGSRYLPIWIGAVEASAIAFQQQGVESARPLTHDLIKDVLQAVGHQLESVHITELRDDVFYAELHLAGGITVSARPSDAIALALRCEVDILGTDSVLDAAGVEMEGADDEESLGSEPAPNTDDEIAEFREFLNTISPDDFAEGAGPDN